MIKAIKQKGIVGKDGTIQLDSTGLDEGTQVEIIVLVSSSETDDTEYLLSAETNRQELLNAIDRVEKQENLVTITSQEWHEKYCI